MMRTDTTYRISVKTERNTFIKEKAGSIALMITMIFLGIVTALLIVLDYFLPAIMTGMLILLQPILLILISNILEKQYPDN